MEKNGRLGDFDDAEHHLPLFYLSIKLFQAMGLGAV
jgi:hypothetical protein